MDKEKLIKSMDFCRVVSNKIMKQPKTSVDQSGAESWEIKSGMVVLVVGPRALPLSKSDPYTQRIYFGIVPVINNEVKHDYEVLIVDPKSLEKLTGNELDEHQEMLQKQFNPSDSEKN